MRDAQMGRIKNNLGVAELMLHYCLFFFLHNSFTGKAQREKDTDTERSFSCSSFPKCKHKPGHSGQTRLLELSLSVPYRL